MRWSRPAGVAKRYFAQTLILFHSAAYECRGIRARFAISIRKVCKADHIGAGLSAWRPLQRMESSDGLQQSASKASKSIPASGASLLEHALRSDSSVRFVRREEGSCDFSIIPKVQLWSTNIIDARRLLVFPGSRYSIGGAEDELCRVGTVASKWYAFNVTLCSI